MLDLGPVFRTMKILHVGNFDRQGFKQVCPNAEYFSYEFQKLGHQMDDRYEAETTASELIETLGRGCDMLFVEEARLRGDHIPDRDGKNIIKGYFTPVMQEARKLGVPIVAWLNNLYFMPQREAELRTNPVFKADIVFSTDGGHQKEFEELGINHVLLRQGIHLPEAHFGVPNFDTTAEIGFIGTVGNNLYAYRNRLVEFLKGAYGDKFQHFGQDGRIRHEPLNNLIATLKIVVGDTMFSPYYWSNRVYEMIGRGAFLVFPWVRGIEEEFEPYKHFIPYDGNNFEQLKEIIDYYLERPEERRKIQEAGLEHCRKHHTYEHRVKKLLEVLVERKIITREKAFPHAQRGS